MELFKSNLLVCPASEHCSQWVRNYMNYCLCTRKDCISLILGLISVLSWVVAEVPQIIMNYKEKSSEGLAMGFLLTWIVGDLFNVCGCLLEPATLPTQFYIAVLYFFTTLSLVSQTIYYGYFSLHKIESVDKKQLVSGVGLVEESTVPMLSKFTPSLPVLSVDDSSSPETVYYSSARSLSRSPTRTMNFLHSHRTNTNKCDEDVIQEALLGGHAPRQSPPSETKNMLCVVFSLTIFLCTYNLKLARNSYPKSDSVKTHNGIVLQVGRKLLQVSGSLAKGSDNLESIGIGTFLGWGMAAIYMSARVPQIFLNFRRGNVQGLNPLMFIFALVANSTYLSSILVSSLEWSKIKPNLPWVVESSGCIILDTFILTQFIYFRHRKHNCIQTKNGDLDPAN